MTYSILVVDDDEAIKNSVEEFLTIQNYKVQSAANAQQALDMLQIFNADIVITDITLQGMDGLELTKKIKSKYHADVMVMTGYSAEYSYEEAVKAGASDFIFKPFKFEELELRISRVLRESEIKQERVTLLKKLEKLAFTDLKESTIKRSIEFPPEYYQAGMNILTYFQTVLRTKFPNDKVKIKIEQEDFLVTMVVESSDGDFLCKVEETLEQYGLVVKGELSPEKFIDNKLQVIELKSHLNLATAQIKNQQLLLNEKERQYDKLANMFTLLGDVLIKQSPDKIIIAPNIATTISPSIKPVLNVTIQKELPLIHGALNKFIEGMPSNAPNELEKVQIVRDKLNQIKDYNDPKKVKESASMSKLRRLIQEFQEKGSTLNNVINTTKDGFSIIQDLASHYNSIADWCGLPHVPKLFLK